MPYLVDPWINAGRFGAQPVLSGPAVSLRPWAESDAPLLVSAYADPDIRRWHCRTLDLGEAAELVNTWNSGWDDMISVSWAVVGPAGEVLGRAGFREMSFDTGVAEVAYWTLPSARGRGVAPAAVEVLLRWAFAEAGFHRLELMHSVENPASCRVATAAGFSLEGTLRSSLLHTDGWHDMHLHARVSELDQAGQAV